MGYESRKNFWFEIEDGWRGWITTPNAGATSNPESWGADGTLLNGGGYAIGSWGSHKVYQFGWPASSPRQDAQFMKSLADGTYGRGLVHFILPTIYDMNILAPRVADPSMAVDDEGASLVYGLSPEGVPTSGWQTNMLPMRSAYYNLAVVPAGYRGREDSVYIPIPDGYTLYLGAFYSATGSGGVFTRPVFTSGIEGVDSPVTALDNDSSAVVYDSYSGVRGVRLWLGKTASGPATVTATALIARLVKTSVVESFQFGYGEGGYGEQGYAGDGRPAWITEGPWVGGMGHSGCRFVGKPTWENNTGVGGGQIGYAATFREVGSWVYG